MESAGRRGGRIMRRIPGPAPPWSGAGDLVVPRP